MEPTSPSGHWLDWFSEAPSSSQPTPQQSSHHSIVPSDSPALQPRHHSGHSLPRYTQDRSHHVDHGLPPPPPPPSGQHSTSRSQWRWSAWSSPNNSLTTSRRNNRSNAVSAMVERRHRHSWMDQHKRRTYPPRAMRVLKQEQRRLTQGKSGKKSRLLRLLGTYNSSRNSLIGDTDKKLRDAFFQQPRRRRHSLTGVLTSFVHSTSSLSTPPTLSSSNTNGSPQNRTSGLGSSSSSSSSPRHAGHPFSSQRAPSSSRKSAKVTPPTVRSSMVLHYTDDGDDEDSASLYPPDVVYQGHENSRSTLGSASGGGGKSISSRRRQKQPLVRSGGGHRWFSHWIPHHSRRQRRPRNHDKTQRHPAMVMNTNGSSSKIHPSPHGTTTTTSSTDSDEKKTRLKTTLPLLHHATLSDLSSLSSAPSHLLSNKAPTTHPPPSLSAYRFSVFWKSSEGKSGKRVIHVDERGHAGHATLCSRWNTCNHTTSSNLLASFFVVGFLACPFWWVGAVLYLSKASAFADDMSAVSLWTPRTFGHLNCWMSAVSVLLLGFLAALAIWYHLDVA